MRLEGGDLCCLAMYPGLAGDNVNWVPALFDDYVTFLRPIVIQAIIDDTQTSFLFSCQSDLIFFHVWWSLVITEIPTFFKVVL